MAMPISGLSALSPMIRPEAGGAAALRGPSGGTSFQDMLMQSLNEVNQIDSRAQASVAQTLVDPSASQTGAYIDMVQADLAFRTMMQVRNKLMEAFNELRQMQM